MPENNPYAITPLQASSAISSSAPQSMGGSAGTGTYSGDPFTIVINQGNGITHNLSLSLNGAAGTSPQIVDVTSNAGTATVSPTRAVLA